MPNLTAKTTHLIMYAYMHDLYITIKKTCMLILPIMILTIDAAHAYAWYVSVHGNNTDASNWETAWNELCAIQWDLVQPGDTIYLDGGDSEIIYNTGIEITKSGTAESPIVIRLSSEPGRDGCVVINGGREDILPDCGGSKKPYSTANDIGVDYNHHEYIILDGRKWNGIRIHRHNHIGVRINGGNNIVRFLEVYDNGSYSYIDRFDCWVTDYPGISLGASDITIEYCIVHDNGQDAIQGGGHDRVRVYRCWLYNSRAHKSKSNEPFNYENHVDGIQLHGEDDYLEIHGLSVEDCIIGPGHYHGLILGDAPGGVSCTLHDFTMINTLIVGLWTGNSNNGLLTHTSGNPDSPRNYRLDHVTIAGKPYESHGTLQVYGSDHCVTNSIFYGWDECRINSKTDTGNYYYAMDRSSIGSKKDPLFKDMDYNGGVGPDFDDFDFTPQEPACKGKGSTITKPQDLFNLAPDDIAETQHSERSYKISLPGADDMRTDFTILENSAMIYTLRGRFVGTAYYPIGSTPKSMQRGVNTSATGPAAQGLYITSYKSNESPSRKSILLPFTQQ